MKKIYLLEYFNIGFSCLSVEMGYDFSTKKFQARFRVVCIWCWYCKYHLNIYILISIYLTLVLHGCLINTNLHQLLINKSINF